MLYRTVLRCLLASFSGSNLLLHALAVISTVVLVLTGIDWAWGRLARTSDIIQYLGVGAALAGVAAPVLVPVVAFGLGRARPELGLRAAGIAMGLAVVFSFLLSTLLKAFTGRLAPEPFETLGGVDFSTDFRFGWLAGEGLWDSVIEGWPSGHAMTVVAMVVAGLFFCEHRGLRIVAVAFALYMVVGVSATIHWASDAVAGALVGIAIGRGVGWTFRSRS